MSLIPDMADWMMQGDHWFAGDGGRQLAAGGLEISVDTHRVRVNGIHVALRPIEFRLLFYFMAHAERVHSRSQLLDRAWKKKVSVGERTVDVHVRRLRAALEPFGLDELIQTVHGSGYRFSGVLNESEKKDAEVKPGMCNRAEMFGNPVAILPT